MFGGNNFMIGQQADEKEEEKIFEELKDLIDKKYFKSYNVADKISQKIYQVSLSLNFAQDTFPDEIKNNIDEQLNYIDMALDECDRISSAQSAGKDIKWN